RVQQCAFVALAFLLGRVTGAAADPDVVRVSIPVRVLAVDDFDGDGKSDMTLYQSGGAWRILKSSSAFTASTTASWGGAGYAAVPGDYDGDGKTDPAVYNLATGQWTALLSSTGYATTFTQNLGGPGYVPVPGYYDGDGKPDPAVYPPATRRGIALKWRAEHRAT